MSVHGLGRTAVPSPALPSADDVVLVRTEEG